MIKNYSIFGIFIICIALLSFHSCKYEDNTKIDTYIFNTDSRHWQWNQRYNRYEYLMEFPELNEKIYEGGGIQGSVFINEIDASGNSFEGQKPLPFIQTYYSGTQIYTETISFDTSKGNPSTVCFYIQPSGLNYYIPRSYTFKITLIGE